MAGHLDGSYCDVHAVGLRGRRVGLATDTHATMERTVVFSAVCSEATMEVFSMGPIPGSVFYGSDPRLY
jgi:hypothetical protein